MDRGRSRSGGRRGPDRASRKTSKRVGYMPRSGKSQRTGERRAQYAKQGRRGAAEGTGEMTAGTSGRFRQDRKRDGGGKRTRRDRSENLYSSDQYLSIATDDDGVVRDGQGGKGTTETGTGGGQRGQRGSAGGSRFSSRRRSGRGRQRGRRSPDESRDDTYRSRSASWTDRSASYEYVYRYADEDTDESAQRNGRRRNNKNNKNNNKTSGRVEHTHRSQSPFRRAKARNERSQLASGRRVRGRSPSYSYSRSQSRSRSRSPPPPPRQRPHQPQSRKYARQEGAAVAPRSERARDGHVPRRDRIDSTRGEAKCDARAPSNRRRRIRCGGDSPASRSRSLWSSPSSSGEPDKDAPRTQRDGPQVSTPQDAATLVPPAAPNLPSHPLDGTLRSALTPPSATPFVHTTQPTEAVASAAATPAAAEEVKMTPAERELKYLAWLYSKPSTAKLPGLNTRDQTKPNQASAATPQPPPPAPAVTGSSLLSSLRPPLSPASTTSTPQKPWEGITVETRFHIATNCISVGLTDWPHVLDELERRREAAQIAQPRPEEEEDKVTMRAAPADSSLHASATHTPRRLLSAAEVTAMAPPWALSSPAHVPEQLQAGRHGSFAAPDCAGDAGSTPTTPFAPPSPTRDSQVGPTSAPTASCSMPDVHTPQLPVLLPSAGVEDDGFMLSASAHKLPHGQTPRAHLATGRDNETDFGLGSRQSTHVLEAASGRATPRTHLEHLLHCVEDTGSEWIPAVWRTNPNTGDVYPSRLFSNRETFLEAADVEAAKVFQWHFERGFAHRQPPWFTCSDMDSNAELPWACEWLNQLPKSLSLGEQVAQSRAKVATWRAHQESTAAAEEETKTDS